MSLILTGDQNNVPGMKLVYVKRWRTIVQLPEQYADEIVESLRAAAQPGTEEELTAAIYRAIYGHDMPNSYLTTTAHSNANNVARALLTAFTITWKDDDAAQAATKSAPLPDRAGPNGKRLPLLTIKDLAAIGCTGGPHNIGPSSTWCECCGNQITQYRDYYTWKVCSDCDRRIKAGGADALEATRTQILSAWKIVGYDKEERFCWVMHADQLLSALSAPSEKPVARDCQVSGCGEYVGNAPDPRWDQGRCPVCSLWYHKSASPHPGEANSSDGTAGKAADPQCQRPPGEDTSGNGAGAASRSSETNPQPVWYEWIEPFGDGPEILYCRMPARDIIAFQKRRPEYTSATDEDALHDFVVVHWAKPATPPRPALSREGSPDDIRAMGWTVAIHNDYRLDGVPHTFWLFTKDGAALKGEGVSDAAALNAIRAILSAQSQGGAL